MNAIESSDRSPEKTLLQKLSDTAYIARRAGLVWIIPVVYSAVPTGMVGIFGLEYHEYHKKHVAGTVETILELPDKCDPVVIAKRHQDAKIINPAHCSVTITQETTAGLTTEYRKPFYDDGNWDTTYGSQTQVAQYAQGTKNYIKTLKPGSIYTVQNYELNGQFLGFIPRAAPYTRRVQIPYEFQLDSPLGNRVANFQKAKNFKLIPGINVPTDEELRGLGQKIQHIIGRTSNGSTRIDITGIASPEGFTPESLIGEDQVSLDKNKRLAYDRAEYVKQRLVELYPDLSVHINQITGQVNILTPEEVDKLHEIAQKIGMTGVSIGDIDALIKKFESGTISLDSKDNQYISTLFMRSVKVFVSKNESKNRGGELSSGLVDYNHLELLEVAVCILYFFGLIVFPYGAFQRGRLRIHKDYYEYHMNVPVVFERRKERLGKRAMKILDLAEQAAAIESGGEYL